MKKVWHGKKLQNLKEQALQLIQKNEKLERQIATLQGNDRAETMKSTKKGDDEREKTQICIKSTLKINCEDQNESRSGLISKKAPDGKVQIMMRKRGNKKEGKTSCHAEPNDICEKRIEKRICNTDGKLPKEYRLRVGNEREWIGRIKELMERQHTKPLEQKLAELMPLVRYHQDIKNAIKAKRIAVQQQSSTESVNEFLNRLSDLYGRNRNSEFHRKINKKIKCNKCKKRGHLRRNCKIKQVKAV